MPLELDAIYGPFEDFFLRQFQPLAGGVVQFRFDRTPARFADSDFATAQLGTATAQVVADERLAFLVDGIPLLDADGRSAEFGPRSLSELYRDQLVTPAVARTDTLMMTNAERDASVDMFNRLKVDALSRLEQSRRASVLGASTFQLSVATPAMWWNRADPGVWTRQQFEVGRASLAAPKRTGRLLMTIKSRFGNRSAPTISGATISFDYCVVNVARPWLSTAFLEHPEWYIPGESLGRFSANDGVGMPALPVGFVAIQRLSISAQWSAEDISALQQSAQFGPFAFDSQVNNGAISHQGIQIVGWLLQNVPTLPPAYGTPGGISERELGSIMDRNGLTNAQPDGLPKSPPVRNGQPIPFVQNVNHNGYRALVASNRPCVVFVSAAWAGPSRQSERVVELLAREHRDAVTFAELEVDGLDGTPLGTALAVQGVPTFLGIVGGVEVFRVIGMAPELLIEHVRTIRYGARMPTSEQLPCAFLVGVMLVMGVPEPQWLDEAHLLAVRDVLSKPIRDMQEVMPRVKACFPELVPQAANSLFAGAMLGICLAGKNTVAESDHAALYAATDKACLPREHVSRLMSSLAATTTPQERYKAYYAWLVAGELLFPRETFEDRSVPLFGVPLIDASMLGRTIQVRDTLVFYSRPSNVYSRDLDSLVQSVSALYAPRFQTCEVWLPEPRSNEKVSAPTYLPGTFVLYRKGVATATVVRPLNRSQLAKDLGLV